MNVAKNCKGGRDKDTPHWIFKQYLSCNNMSDFEVMQDKHHHKLGAKYSGYFYRRKITNEEQFPAV